MSGVEMHDVKSQRINKKCEKRGGRVNREISPKKQYQRRVTVLVGSMGQRCWHQQPLLRLALLMFQTPWLYSMKERWRLYFYEYKTSFFLSFPFILNC